MQNKNQNSPNQVPWELLSYEEVREHFESPEGGLSSEEVAKRLVKYGPNALAEERPTPLWRMIASQFESPLILILLVAALITLFTGDYEDTFFIGIVLFLNTLLSTSQEFRADRGARALKHLTKVAATVERNSRVIEINSNQLVPGDIVFLESGSIVPADIRLENTNALEVDESILTGESVATSKDAEWSTPSPVNLADTKNMLYAGTTVSRGRASGIVVETGTRTELGKIAGDVATELGGVPPLVQRMKRFSKTIGIAVIVISGCLASFEFIIHDSTIAESFEFAVALAISAIPEGLPIALTITLAVGSRRMSKRNAIVRRLAAVEGLGSCTLIATDKTGTLTCNELTIKLIQLADGSKFHVSGEGFFINGEISADGASDEPTHHQVKDIVIAGILCNEADLVPREDDGFHRHGDAVDLALLVLGFKAGLQRDSFAKHLPQIHSIPFEPELQFSATWHHDLKHSRTNAYFKGSPERILEMSNLSESDRQSQLKSAKEIASKGYRVIALANSYQTGLTSRKELPSNPSELNFLGFVAMIDPPRPGVKQAVKQCHKAGVEVIMITGDHQLTALAIATDLGIVSEEMNRNDVLFTGNDIEKAEPDELLSITQKGRVFARVSPRQKLELVKAAQQLGHFVSVTGDGANDAPALKTANIAIAMGKSGTDVARESADLVLSDDNFATIVAGIEEGRIAYDNIRKVIVLLVSTGIGEILMVLMALLTGFPLPLTPLQLLWLNVATEAIQDEALAFEPNEGDAMERKPRPPDEPIFNRIMIERIFVGACVMGFVGFGLFAVLMKNDYSVKESRNALLLLMVLFENVHIGNCRSELKSAFSLSPMKNPIIVIGVALAFTVHLTAMHTPWLQRVLQVQPIESSLWLILILLAFTILPAVEIHKWYCRKRIIKETVVQ